MLAAMSAFASSAIANGLALEEDAEKGIHRSQAAAAKSLPSLYLRTACSNLGLYGGNVSIIKKCCDSEYEICLRRTPPARLSRFS